MIHNCSSIVCCQTSLSPFRVSVCAHMCMCPCSKSTDHVCESISILHSISLTCLSIIMQITVFYVLWFYSTSWKQIVYLPNLFFLRLYWLLFIFCIFIYILQSVCEFLLKSSWTFYWDYTGSIRSSWRELILSQYSFFQTTSM